MRKLDDDDVTFSDLVACISQTLEGIGLRVCEQMNLDVRIAGRYVDSKHIDAHVIEQSRSFRERRCPLLATDHNLLLYSRINHQRFPISVARPTVCAWQRMWVFG